MNLFLSLIENFRYFIYSLFKEFIDQVQSSGIRQRIIQESEKRDQHDNVCRTEEVITKAKRIGRNAFERIRRSIVGRDYIQTFSNRRH